MSHEDREHPRGKTNLSRLVEGALKGEPFIIARAGKPLVKVVMLDTPEPQRIAFLEGQGDVPDDFDTMFSGAIEALFEGRAAWR